MLYCWKRSAGPDMQPIFCEKNCEKNIYFRLPNIPQVFLQIFLPVPTHYHQDRVNLVFVVFYDWFLSLIATQETY